MALHWPHQYPFFRLLIPLMAGIAYGDRLFFKEISLNISHAGTVAGAFLLTALLVLPLQRHSLRWIFGLCLLCFLFMAGLSRGYQQLQRCESPAIERGIHRVTITENPTEKKRSLLCPASLEKRKVLLYLPRSPQSAAIRRGDELMISASISLPPKENIPQSFDYRRFLIRKGISGTGYVPDGQWHPTGNHLPRFSLRQTALDCREVLLNIYRKTTLSPNETALLSALTLGYKEELSETVKESFAVSGASHILALSGLHVGFIYMILLFFCGRKRSDSHLINFLKIVFMLSTLWGFAFITGLSPSVVRAVIMGSLVCLSFFTGNPAQTFNLLSAAAFGMLIYNPSWLFDVGFQLSFTAVTAILFIHPWLFRQIKTSHRFTRYLWKLTSVSIAAQIGTTPLVLFYFSRFATYSLLSNLLVVPLLPLIIGLGISLWVLFPLQPLQAVAVWCLQTLLTLLHTVVARIGQLPHASLHSDNLRAAEILGIYLSIYLLGRYIAKRRPKELLFLLGNVLLLLINYYSSGSK